MRGFDAYHVCGTDEHGTPILARAIEEKKTPKEIVDYYYQIIKRSLEKTHIHFDIFSRTTKPHHYKMTQKFYERAKKAGYIYMKEIPILYCEVDRIALPDRLVKGNCPYCGAPNQYGDHCEVCGRTYSAFQLKNPRCSICNNQPVIKYSKHAFFALSEFSERLEKWVKEEVKLTRGVREHVLHWIREKLQDWDITRDISWGVPVPDIPNQVFYVWWDAPIGYVSFTKELFGEIGKDWERIWIDGEGRIVHFIGKDIIYHHVLFWPAMLMANEFALPNEIRVRGFATLEGQKMSKSRGIYIGLEEFMDYWPAEYLRFYWALTTPESLDDGDFSLREYQEKINKTLIGEVGNFVHRVLTLIKRGNIQSGSVDKGLQNKVLNLVKDYETKMLDNKFDAAIEVMLEIARIGNRTLSITEPWKNLSSETSRKVLVTLFNFTRLLSVLLTPILPESSKKMRKMLGIVEDAKTAYEFILNTLDTDATISIIRKFLTQTKKIEPLFKKIAKEDIEKIRLKLGTST